MIGSTHHPDASLLTLGEELEACWSVERDICREIEALDLGDGRVAAAEERLDAGTSLTAKIARRIEKERAKTVDGLMVQARAIQWARGCEDVEFGDTADVRLAAVIVATLVEMRDLQRSNPLAA